jgi:hypothetical protein
MNTENVTKQQIRAAIEATAAVAEAIRELRSVPNGELYAQVMGKMDLEYYNGILRTLKNAGLVEETGHVLRWVGPEVGR